MKGYLVGGLVLVAVSLVGCNPGREPAAESTSPTPTTQAELATCAAEDLQASLMLEGAAGSTEGSLRVMKESEGGCRLGNIMVDLQYPEAVTNLRVDQSASETLELLNGQVVTADVRFPNGAQCDQPTGVTVLLEVKVDNQQIEFADTTEQNFEVMVCDDASQETVVQVGSFAME